MLLCCSDFRLCNRGLKEYAISEEAGEEAGEMATEADSVHSENQDDTDECSSSNLVNRNFCEEEERIECLPDHPEDDGECAQDVGLMKSMGLPLSFTASKRREKKVDVLLFIKATRQTEINLNRACSSMKHTVKVSYR